MFQYAQKNYKNYKCKIYGVKSNMAFRILRDTWGMNWKKKIIFKPFFWRTNWVSSRANLQFQVPSSGHHPNIFCLILRRSSELHLIDLSTPQLLPVYCQVCIRISCFEVVLVFVFVLSAILFALSDLSHANIFYCFCSQWLFWQLLQTQMISRFASENLLVNQTIL